MPLTFTAAASSRISKPQKPKSPLASLRNQRRKSASPVKAPPALRKQRSVNNAADEDAYAEKLEDHGLIACLATDLKLSDVAQQVRYIHENAFDEIPARSGFNSTRTAEVLIFRRAIPPVVSVPHILALNNSHTIAEREIAHLIRQGILRRIRIPNRGLGGNSAVGNGLVLCDDWFALVKLSRDVNDDVKETYISTLKKDPEALTATVLTFTPREASQLSKAGFLTSDSLARSASAGMDTFATPSDSTQSTLLALSSAGSRAAAGSLEAVGGANAIHSVGGGGAALSAAERRHHGAGIQYLFSLPSMGPYLKLLQSSRDHLVRLLGQSRYREAPVDWLKERWDGAPAVSGSSAMRERKAGGLSAPLLPAKTRKWKQFYGLRFEWVLEECLGTGLVEVFETGSVGQGVRLT